MLCKVALLAEGVDRNPVCPAGEDPSPQVALLAEGVDRNNEQSFSHYKESESPSSRRAWIEISNVVIFYTSKKVALLAEGVDRNWFFGALFKASKCRPPRGGRG